MLMGKAPKCTSRSPAISDEGSPRRALSPPDELAHALDEVASVTLGLEADRSNSIRPRRIASALGAS